MRHKTIKLAKKVSKNSIKSTANSKKWKKVKIAGNLVSDDGGGLEGLIGLEIMEDYGTNVIKTDKV